jgi:hypothetical protein
LAIGRARIGRLEIDELSVRRLLVTEKSHAPRSMAAEPSTQPIPVEIYKEATSAHELVAWTWPVGELPLSRTSQAGM